MQFLLDMLLGMYLFGAEEMTQHFLLLQRAQIQFPDSNHKMTRAVFTSSTRASGPVLWPPVLPDTPALYIHI